MARRVPGPEASPGERDQSTIHWRSPRAGVELGGGMCCVGTRSAGDRMCCPERRSGIGGQPHSIERLAPDAATAAARAANRCRADAIVAAPVGLGIGGAGAAVSCIARRHSALGTVRAGRAPLRLLRDRGSRPLGARWLSSPRAQQQQARNRSRHCVAQGSRKKRTHQHRSALCTATGRAGRSNHFQSLRAFCTSAP
jgi:hypothetical protein